MKKKTIIISVIVLVVLAIGGFVGYKVANKEKETGEYDTLVSEDETSIHYRYNFEDVSSDSISYKIKDYNIEFNFNDEGESSFKVNNDNEVKTDAKLFDVYYLKSLKTLFVLDVNDFGMGMNMFDKDKVINISKNINGAFSIKDMSIEDDTWKFIVNRYSNNYLVVSDDSIFNLCVDDYRDYVDKDFSVEESFEYDLTKKDFKLDDFKRKSILTIEELVDNIGNKCENVDNKIISDETKDDMKKEGEKNGEN